MEKAFADAGLHEALNILEQQDINDSNIHHITDDEIKELFPKIGLRIAVRQIIKSLAKDTGDSISPNKKDSQNSLITKSLAKDTGDTVSLNFVDPQNSFRILDNSEVDIEYINIDQVDTPESTTKTRRTEINSSVDGRTILKEGKTSLGLLKEGSRRKLSQIIIQEVLENNKTRKISQEEFTQIAEEITGLFSRESTAIYYSPYCAAHGNSAKKNSSGKLYESYINARRKLRKTGDLPGTSRSQSRSSSATSASTLTTDSEIDFDYEENIQFLKNNVEPWTTVQEKWRSTQKIRLDELNKLNKDIHSYYTEFPALKQPEGYTLLLEDFNYLYPDKENHLFSGLPFKTKEIIALALYKSKNSRDKTTKTEISDILSLADEHNTETQINISLLLLTYLINISPAPKSKKKGTWKPTRAEVREGFILLVPTEAEVTTLIIEKREKFTALARRVQPYVIVVGTNIASVKAAYVVVNDTVYKFTKLLTAVDCCFKIFQATGACYPEESSDIWHFLQIGFYNIITDFDRNTQAVNTLLTDLGLIKDRLKK